MRYLVQSATAATLMLAGVDLAQAESPIFEVGGFPVTSHQILMVDTAQVRERSLTPTLTLAGMAASLHQVSVLTPRQKAQRIAPMRNVEINDFPVTLHQLFAE
jgi:hypothetical protein